MRIFFSIFLFLLIVSCKNASNDIEVVLFEDTIQSSQLLPYATYDITKIKSPRGIFFHNNCLIINSATTDTLIHVLDIRDKFKIIPVSGRGSAKHELLTANKIFKIDSVNFGVFDISKAIIYRLNLDSLLQRENKDSIDIFYSLLDSNRTCYSPSLLNDSILVSPSYKESKCRLTFFNLKGNKIYSSGTYLPQKNKYEPPFKIIAQSYQCATAYDKNLNRIILANRYTDKLEVYSSSGNLLYYISGPMHKEAVYNVSRTKYGPMFSQNPKTRLFMYLGVQSANSSIYALFLGKGIYSLYPKNFVDTTKSETYVSSPTIYVFNASGNCTQKLNLSIPAIYFCIDDNSNRLFVLNINRKIDCYKL